MNLTLQKIDNIVQKKIYIYEILCEKNDEEKCSDFSYLNELLEEMNNQIDTLKKHVSTNRWYSIERMNFNNDYTEIKLINCKYNYRPNLIDIRTKIERASPKSADEGDKESTHALIKNNLVAFEYRRSGTSISVFNMILNEIWNSIRAKYDSNIKRIVLKQILEKNFFDIIKKSKRIKNVKFDVFCTNSGSDYYNLYNEKTMHETYCIEYKAKKRQSIEKQPLLDKIEGLFINKEVSKVTVDVDDEENNKRIINSDVFAKQIYIYVNKNDNGEVISEDIFQKMSELI